MFIQGGRPAAELEWLKDGKPVTELQKVGKDHDWMLGIDFFTNKTLHEEDQSWRLLQQLKSEVNKLLLDKNFPERIIWQNF